MEWIYFGLQEIIGFQSCIIVTQCIFFCLRVFVFHALFIELFKREYMFVSLLLSYQWVEKITPKK